MIIGYCCSQIKYMLFPAWYREYQSFVKPHPMPENNSQFPSPMNPVHRSVFPRALGSLDLVPTSYKFPWASMPTGKIARWSYQECSAYIVASLGGTYQSYIPYDIGMSLGRMWPRRQPPFLVLAPAYPNEMPPDKALGRTMTSVRPLHPNRVWRKSNRNATEVKNPLDKINPNLKTLLESTAVARLRSTARNILEEIGTKEREFAKRLWQCPPRILDDHQPMKRKGLLELSWTRTMVGGRPTGGTVWPTGLFIVPVLVFSLWSRQANIIISYYYHLESRCSMGGDRGPRTHCRKNRRKNEEK